MRQGDFDWMKATLVDIAPTLPPRSHRDDPESSHAAEKRSSKTWGKKHGDLILLLSSDDNVRGLTASELASNPWLAHNGHWPAGSHERLCEVRKRLSDLLTPAVPLVTRVHVQGDRESTWSVVEPSA